MAFWNRRKRKSQDAVHSGQRQSSAEQEAGETVTAVFYSGSRARYRAASLDRFHAS